MIGEISVVCRALRNPKIPVGVRRHLQWVFHSPQQRYFGYDSAGRLTQASNPESGVTNYTYDSNGNVQTKTDARNITSTASAPRRTRYLS